MTSKEKFSTAELRGMFEAYEHDNRGLGPDMHETERFLRWVDIDSDRHVAEEEIVELELCQRALLQIRTALGLHRDSTDNLLEVIAKLREQPSHEPDNRLQREPAITRSRVAPSAEVGADPQPSHEPRAVTLSLLERDCMSFAAGMDTPWPLHDVLAKLIEATDHLLDVHDCDTHGHEEFRTAAIAGKELLARHQSQPARADIGADIPPDGAPSMSSPTQPPGAWRSIKRDPPPRDTQVLLYSPPENLSNDPHQPADMRVDVPQNFTWATHWHELPPPPASRPTKLPECAHEPRTVVGDAHARTVCWKCGASLGE